MQGALMPTRGADILCFLEFILIIVIFELFIIEGALNFIEGDKQT